MESDKSPESSEPPLGRKRKDHSEWLEKALEEGGARKRRSKKISDPDFVFSDGIHNKSQRESSPVRDAAADSTSSTASSVARDILASRGLPSDLDYENMSHYEKFFKYKKEYKEYRTLKREQLDLMKSPIVAPKEICSTLETTAGSEESTLSAHTDASPVCDTPPSRSSRGRRRGRALLESRKDTPYNFPRRQVPRFDQAKNSSQAQKRLEAASQSEDSLEAASECEDSSQAQEEKKEDTNESERSAEDTSLVALEQDKYCWYCHKEVESRERPGVDEKRCKSCGKVFHVRCNPVQTDSEGEEWECKPCIEYRELKEKDLWAPYVEYLGYDKYILQIRYIIDKVKKYPSAKEFLHPVNRRLFPDYHHYIAHPVNFEEIERRLISGEYRSVETLYEDFKWMFHNSVIFNGSSSAITKDFRSLLRYLRMDLYDLDSCACCYIHAYTRPEAWFILPCPSPHLLVWAQLKGFPHWPAKVYDSQLEQRPGEILVKFFGDHARSWIPFENIYLYSLDPPSSYLGRKKKKQSMIPSLVEMDTHIELLKKQFGVFKYPAQDIAIGKTAEERALQLKNMLPSCSTCLPQKPCAIQNAPSTSSGSNEAPKAATTTTTTDLNDASSKRNLLSRLEERLQQGCSDSEDSVKSFGKTNKSTLPCRNKSKAQRSVRCHLFFKVLEKNMIHAHKIHSKKLEILKKRKIKKSSNNLAGSKTNSPEKPTGKIEGGGETQGSPSATNEETHHAELHPNDNPSTSSKINFTEKINENTTVEIKEPEGANHLETGKEINVANMKETDASVESSVSSKLEESKKPNCDDIDRFIENHLASSQQTTEWDETKTIPPILMPRDKRVVQVLAPVQTNEETANKLCESLSKDEPTNLSEKSVISDVIVSKTPSDDNPVNISSNVSEQKDTPVHAINKTEGSPENQASTIDKKTDVKLALNQKRSTFKLKRRLFRHKKYGAQLFELRKLSYMMNRESLKKRTCSESLNVDVKQQGPDISKYFEMSEVKIMNPSVVLSNMTIEEVRELKRNVKLMKHQYSSMNLRDRSKPNDSGFVPIEDTMRISTESDDFNSFSYDAIEPDPTPEKDFASSVIEDVASGNLSSNLSSENVPSEITRVRRAYRPRLKRNKLIDLEKETTDDINTSGPEYCLLSAASNTDGSTGQLNLAQWKLHIKGLVKSLELDPSQLSAKKTESMIVDVTKLKKMTESLLGQNQDGENQICVDTQYCAALNSAELVLYAEYAAEYHTPELTVGDYDAEFEDNM